jgi:hypothetical protein
MMPGEPKPPEPTEFAELDDEVVVKFRPGEYGKVLVTGLTDLVKHYLPTDKHEHVLGFLTWVPADHLEKYLVHALEYASDQTRPKTRKLRKAVRKVGRGTRKRAAV